MTKRVLVVLENAYARNPKRRRQLRDFEFWERAFWVSYSGTMLRKMIPCGPEYHICNTTLKIGKSPDEKFPADLEHIESMIDDIRPDLVVGAGVTANNALRQMGVEHVEIPHPAWRYMGEEKAKQHRLTIAEVLLGCDIRSAGWASL